MFQEIDGTSEKILNYILENHPVTVEAIYKKFFDTTGIGLSYHLKFLIKEDLITQTSDGYIDCLYEPATAGFVYFKVRNKNRFYLFFRSIVAPIIVSFLTTLLTLSLNGTTIKLFGQ